MTNEEFDHITSKKLKDFSSAIPAGLWDKIYMPVIGVLPTDPLDQFFKEKLQDYEAPVSPDMWSRIKPEEEDKRRVFFLLPRASMVAASLVFLIITGTVSAYLYYQKMKLSGTAEIGNSSAVKNRSGNTKIPDTDQQKNIQNNNSILPADADSSDTNNESSNTTIGHIGTETDQTNTGVNSTTTLINKFISPIGSSNTISLTGNISSTENTSSTNSTSNNLQSTLTDITEKEASVTSSDEADNYTPFIKLDASLMRQQKTKSGYSAVEKEVAYQNHAGTIKNVVICPSDKKLRNTDWDLELYTSPDYAFKQVSNNTASQQFMERKDSSETARLSYSAGFRIVKPINDHFSVKAGLQYSQINENFTYKTENEVKTTTVITVRDITLANGTTVSVSDTSVLQQVGFKTNTVRNTYKSIDVPVLLGYQFGNDDFKVGINAGVIVNLSSWYKGVILDTALTAQPLTKDNNVVYKNNIGLGIYAGISFIKRISYNTSIFAEPYLRYNLSDMTTPQSIYNQRFSIGGLSLGLRFNLNKK